MTEAQPHSTGNLARGTQDILNRTPNISVKSLSISVKKEREISHRQQLPYRTLRSFLICLLANHLDSRIWALSRGLKMSHWKLGVPQTHLGLPASSEQVPGPCSPWSPGKYWEVGLVGVS